jgi:hypothetical protein
MPKTEEMTAGAFITQYMRPVATELDKAIAEELEAGGAPFPAPPGVPINANGALNALETVLTFFGLLNRKFEFDIQNPFPDAGAAAPGAPPALPTPPAIAPAEALKSIAEAFKDAEAALNPANLAIATASAEVTLTVQVGGVAGANAVLKFDIGPTPSP